jgi:carbamate kinase
VMRADDGAIIGVEAVIDKDLASALLAARLGADLLAIPTGVEKVAINFGEPDQQWLDVLTVAEATRLAEEGQFGEGSMRPKVEALVGFVQQRPGGAGVITSPERLGDALARRTGTWIEDGR